MSISEVQHLVFTYEWDQHENVPIVPIVEERRAEAVRVMFNAGFEDVDAAIQASSETDHAFSDYVDGGKGSVHKIVAAACRALQRKL